MTNKHSLADYADKIRRDGLFQMNELRVPQHVETPEKKKEAINLLRIWGKNGSTDCNWNDSMADHILDMQRDRWRKVYYGQFGMNTDVPLWRSDHKGYQLIRVLLQSANLLTNDQILTIKNDPAVHLPDELYTELELLGIDGRSTIRHHILKAAETFIG